jgi:hypothetical protein
MTMPPMIGLTGYAYVGKDTLADLLVRSHGYHRLGFADPLYAMLLALNPPVPRRDAPPLLTVRELFNEHGGSWTLAKQDPYHGPGLRGLLQRLGTEAVRKHLGEDTWVRAAARTIDKHDWARTVMSDVRFLNEAEFVRQSGGIVVRIHRSGYGPVNQHVSDAGQDDIKTDLSIVNDGEPSDMIFQLIRYCE